jgi:hypothetical protein
MPFGPAVVVENEADVRRMFKALGGAGKELSKANRKVAKKVETGTRGRAGSGSAQESSAAKALAARATQSAAELAIRNSASVPYGVGAFMGALRYPQFPKWVGSSWDLAAGTGPYAISDYFGGGGVDEVKDEYVKQIAEVLAGAGLIMER